MGFRSRLVGPVLLAVLAGPGASGAATGVGPALHARYAPHRAQDCPTDGLGDLAPGAFSARGVTDSGQLVDLAVLVLLDGIGTAEGRRLVAGVQEAYAPLGIVVRPTFRPVRLRADGRAADGQATGGAFALLDQVRATVPEPPPGFDLVHVLTSKDVVDDAAPRRDGTDELVGVASCVGGIRYDGQEFALSEARFRFHRPGPDDIHVIGMAHEMGHLLGAHHHYGNCAEGRTRDVGNSGSCTVMFAIAVLNSARFGTLEGLVVRGYAVQYA